MVLMEMCLDLAVGRRGIQAMYMLGIGERDVFFADHRSPAVWFLLTLAASIGEFCVFCCFSSISYISLMLF